MNYAELSRKAQDHVQSIFYAEKDKPFIYHSLDHTLKVVAAASQIANHYQLSEKDFFIVTAAAWFHDSGYFSDAKNHEAKGAEMASAFFKDSGLDAEAIQAIANCILATKIPQSPHNRLEEIVCDADLFHLGTDDFGENNKLMRKEAEARTGIKMSKDQWRQGTIRLFEMHHYFTDYCQLLLNDKKNETLQKLKSKAAEKDEKPREENAENEKPKVIEEKQKAATVLDVSVANTTPLPDDPGHNSAATPRGETQPKKKKEEKPKRPDRGIETMFRITSGNNQRLSDMADNKAHIMITVNSIILSAIISLLLRKLDDYDFLRLPTYLILAVCVMTIIFSILATRPSIPPGKFTQQDIDDKKVNLLFFGNFYRMNLEDYTDGMLQVMNDRDFLYGTLIKDVYSQGVVLGRKFRLLRISYNIFMFGLIGSVIAFVLATIIAGR